MYTLTLEQLTKLLEEYKELSDACDAARAAGCLEIEGRLQNAIWSSIETVISFFDPEGWIMWHILENEYGSKGYDAGYDGVLKPIKTPEDLLWLIYFHDKSELDNLKKSYEDALYKIRELEMQVDNHRVKTY
jgi:hypothetical protein